MEVLAELRNALEQHLSVNQLALDAVDQFLLQRPNRSIAQTKADLLNFRQTLHHEYLRHILALAKSPNSPAPPISSPTKVSPSPDPEKNLYQTETGGTDISIEIGVGDPHETVLE